MVMPLEWARAWQGRRAGVERGHKAEVGVGEVGGCGGGVDVMCAWAAGSGRGSKAWAEYR